MQFVSTVNKEKYHFQSTALLALQDSAKAYLTSFFESKNFDLNLLVLY